MSGHGGVREKRLLQIALEAPTPFGIDSFHPQTDFRRRR
jgi:hypothetical protein